MAQRKLLTISARNEITLTTLVSLLTALGEQFTGAKVRATAEGLGVYVDSWFL